MKTEKAYYVGISHYSFRQNEPAEILDVETFYPENLSPRVCFHIRYQDGKEDWCPVDDTETYKLITHENVRLGFIETLTNV